MAKLDLRTAGSHPVRLSKHTQHMTAIRYNHKPSVTNTNATSTLSQGKSKKDYKLSIEDGKDTYTYQGHGSTSEDAVVLLMDEEGDGLTMEIADASIACNLVSAPWEKDAQKLAEQYSTLHTDDIQDHGLHTGLEPSASDDSDPDPSNPFDYRHYIDTYASAATDTARSPYPGSSSPAIGRTSVQTTPSTGPVRRVTKPTVPAPRKTKPRPSVAKPKQPEPVAVPEVRVRAPSVVNGLKEKPPADKITFHFDDSHSSHEDEGDLVLDQSPPKPAKHAAHLRALDGAGPISLRSAASSPGSTGASPLGSRLDTSARDVGVIDLAKDEDSDVEGLALIDHHDNNDPPPTATTSKRRSVADVPEEADDEDDELEAEMLRAMEEADDEDEPEVPQQAAYAEEEEESEEE